MSTTGYEIAEVVRLGNRARNQDRCQVVDQRDAVLLLLADGMGGHEGGDVAAQSFVDSMSLQFRSTTPCLQPASFLTAAVGAAHRHILAQGLQQNPPISPRTTCVACLVCRGTAWWVHAGDSRLYWLRDARVIDRTRDHSVVESLHARGAISPTQMRAHPLRNQVTRCLGGSWSVPPLATSGPATLQKGDVLLLCSDGLWSAVEEQDVARLSADGDFASAVERLALRAEESSYPSADNISAAALRWLEDTVHEREAEGDAGRTPIAQGDLLVDAIQEIERAIREYAAEMNAE